MLTIPALILLGSCATSKSTAQLDQNDDVYYSVASAKEQPETVAQPVTETKRESDYVTDEQLYGDANSNSYYGDYAGRIYRFRDYTPWRSYYSDIYSLYDPYFVNPFYSNSFYSNYYGYNGLGLSFGIGGGFFYNPWRTYGYGNGFWGPYSYYNYWAPSYYGYYPSYGGGYYGGGYGNINPDRRSPNYRPRPERSSGSIPANGGMIREGAVRGIERNPNGNTIQRRERPATQTPTGRPQQAAPRPERVQQAQPQRQSPPPRINTAPSNNDTGGGRSSGGGNARPSRTN